MRTIINLLRTKLNTLKIQQQVNKQLLAHHSLDLVEEVPEKTTRQLEETIHVLEKAFFKIPVQGTPGKDREPQGSRPLSKSMKQW